MRQRSARREASERNDWLRYPPTNKRRTNPKLRKAVLAEQPRCQCGAPATEMDHIRPVSLGGGDERENLQGLCRPCHLSKSGTEANYIRWIIRRRINMDRGNGGAQ
jgi:5-methylcytosine-specific restriction protein A